MHHLVIVLTLKSLDVRGDLTDLLNHDLRINRDRTLQNVHHVHQLRL